MGKKYRVVVPFPRSWDFSGSDGNCIEGVLKAKREGIGPNSSRAYTVDAATETGIECVTLWGSTVIDTLMEKAKEGDAIKLTFLGWEKKPKDRERIQGFSVGDS